MKHNPPWMALVRVLGGHRNAQALGPGATHDIRHVGFPAEKVNPVAILVFQDEALEVAKMIIDETFDLPNQAVIVVTVRGTRLATAAWLWLMASSGKA
jgi:hypothetical protein